MTFRQLVDEFRSRGRIYAPPRFMAAVAAQFGVSRTTLYNLMNGRRGAADWTVRRISRATGWTEEYVCEALANSRKNR